MKRTIMFVMAVLLASSVSAKATQADWDVYKATKTNAHADIQALEDGTYAGTTATVVGEWNEIATLADTKLMNATIVVWAHNNAAYSLILYFKHNLGWSQGNAETDAMPNTSKEDRLARLAKVQDLQALAKANMAYLDEAAGYLEKAAGVYSNNGLKSTSLASTIESNRDFIKWVKDFTHSTFK